MYVKLFKNIIRRIVRFKSDQIYVRQIDKKITYLLIELCWSNINFT